MKEARFAAIILAAGEGTRLNSATPKVMHGIAGLPMIRHLIEALHPLDPAETVVVLGPGMERVADAVAPAKIAVQSPPRGTGDAVRAAGPALAGRLAKDDISDVIVLFGDTPLLRPDTIGELLAARRRPPPPPARARGPPRGAGGPPPIRAPMAASCSTPMAASRASSRRAMPH